MYRFQPNRATSSTPRSFASATALVCLLLLALLAFVQVAHVHQTANDADHCQLCVVLHTVVPAVIAAAVIILVQIGTPDPVSEIRPAIGPWRASLFIRPPPDVC